MNITRVDLKTIDRLIAHEIYPKTEKMDAFAKTSKALLIFEENDKKILISRIKDALCNTTKTFQLDYEDKSDSSIYAMLKKYSEMDNNGFITKSIDLAEALAVAHFRTKIPGGFCLIGDGMTSKNKRFFFTIKAELQEVFTIDNNKLHIIKDVFLSPAKDFYKIGFFIENDGNWAPFMYDDQFSLQKKDLTEYFYGQFLGLTTDRNDRLRTKNFYDETKSFIEHNVDNIHDRLGLLQSLKVLYRETTSGIISPRDFSDNYLEGNLKVKFEKAVIEDKYPSSFTRDTSLIENRIELQRISIPLSYELSLVGSTDVLNDVEIFDDPTEETMRNLQPQINNKSINKIIVLKQAATI
ncbi:MAG: hypothetical protein ACTHM7_08215 [Ginsengibacter sp.]